MRSGGHGFAGIARKRLLNILQERARALGVRLRFETEVEALDACRDADLIVAADGINSRIRNRYAAAFRPSIELRTNRYIWLGTHQVFDAFTFIFEETEHGWIWAHAYRFDADTSTFIVECDRTWQGLGFQDMSQDDGIAACEMLFERYLDGQRLMSNAAHLRGSAWLNFPRVACERWFTTTSCSWAMPRTRRISRSARAPSSRSRTRSGSPMRCTPGGPGKRARGLSGEPAHEVLRLQSAARNSTEWFEAVPRYVGFEPMQFGCAAHPQPARQPREPASADRTWLEGMERWFAERAGRRPVQTAVPPMFTPFRLRELELANRVAVSPMAMYSAKDGWQATSIWCIWARVRRAGSGLVFTEMTCVTPEGRITPGCAGMYGTSTLPPGRASSTSCTGTPRPRSACSSATPGPGLDQARLEGMDEPLDAGNWQVIGPSDVPWSPRTRCRGR